MQSEELSPSLEPLYPLTPLEKLRRAITWLRVPLSFLGSLALVMFMHDERLFWMGVPFVIIGEMFQVWASSHLSKNTDFTVSGPYAHVRNSMYMGRFILVLGFFIMTGIVPLIVAYVVLYAMYAQVRVKREEKRLEKIFYPDYQHYCNEVHRWMPRLKPYSKANSRRASWSQLCLNNEHLNFIGVVVSLVAVYLRIVMLPNYYWHF